VGACSKCDLKYMSLQGDSWTALTVRGTINGTIANNWTAVINANIPDGEPVLYTVGQESKCGYVGGSATNKAAGTELVEERRGRHGGWWFEST